MQDIVILVVFYIVFMIMAGAAFWGESLERTYQFQKNMYWVRFLGRERYFALSRVLAVIGMIGATTGCILVVLRKL